MKNTILIIVLLISLNPRSWSQSQFASQDEVATYLEGTWNVDIDILKSLADKYDFAYPKDKLLYLAKKVKKIVDDKAKYTDWSKRNDIKAELKVDLIILLEKNGYHLLPMMMPTKRYLSRQRILKRIELRKPIQLEHAITKLLV